MELFMNVGLPALVLVVAMLIGFWLGCILYPGSLPVKYLLPLTRNYNPNDQIGCVVFNKRGVWVEFIEGDFNDERPLFTPQYLVRSGDQPRIISFSVVEEPSIFDTK